MASGLSERHSPSLPSEPVDTKAVKYNYQPLPSAYHIRRLILEQGKGNDPLRGSLETIPLGRADVQYSFEAVSYVWG